MYKKICFMALFLLLITSPCHGAMDDVDFVSLCAQGSPKEVLEAIRNGADVNAVDKYGTTPLMAPAGYDRPEIVSILIKTGAKIDYRDEDGQTALMHHASYNVKIESTQLIIEAGADVNAQDNSGTSVLMHAVGSMANYGNPALVPILVEKGAKINYRDPNGNTVLQHAAYTVNNLEFIENLLKHGADPRIKNNGGATPLMAAASTSDARTVKLFLDLGLPVEEEDEQGFTAFMHASMNNGDPEVFKILLKAGAEVDKRNAGGVTPLMNAVTAPCPSPEVLRVLVQGGAKVNAVDNEGRTALMRAAQHAYSPDMITTLLELGADITMKDSSGKTALDYAVANNQDEEILKILGKKPAPTYEPINYRKAAFGDYAKGTRLLVTGEVSQIIGKDVLLKTRREPYVGYTEDPVYVMVGERVRALTQDLFAVQGTYQGFVEMEDMLGNTLSIPCIKADKYQARERNLQDNMQDELMDGIMDILK